jgi:chromosome segregation ATPase
MLVSHRCLEEISVADLDALITQKQTQKRTLEGSISAATVSQARLVQVDDALDDLLALHERRAELLAAADASLNTAKTDAAAAAASLTPVAALLAELPGTLVVADLDAVRAAVLPAPPDPSKTKYADYVDAFEAAATAFDASQAALELARETLRRETRDLALAEAELAAAVGRAVNAAEDAKSGATEALRARGTSDFVRAYLGSTRTQTSATRVADAATTTAVTDAKAKLGTVFDQIANARDALLKAETDLPQMAAARSRAADQLGAADEQLRKALSDKIKSARPA